MIYTVSNIQWDTDGKKHDLPKTLEIDVPKDYSDPYDVSEFISDEISNLTGFCHKGFTTDPEINE